MGGALIGAAMPRWAVCRGMGHRRKRDNERQGVWEESKMEGEQMCERLGERGRCVAKGWGLCQSCRVTRARCVRIQPPQWAAGSCEHTKGCCVTMAPPPVTQMSAAEGYGC